MVRLLMAVLLSVVCAVTQALQIIDYTIRGESPKLEKETPQYVSIEEFNNLKNELNHIKEQLKHSTRQENRSKQNRPKGGADL